jgi:ABC-type multidrug transport system fused ATPase/permease subunit
MVVPTMIRQPRPKSERAGIRVMYGYIRPHRATLLIGGTLNLGTWAGGLALPLVVRALIGDLSDHRGLADLVVIICALMLADTIVGVIGNYMLRRVAESIALGARQRVLDRLFRIKVSALDHNEPGDLMSRATVDTTLLRDATSTSFVGMATGIATLVATLIIMGLVDPLLLAVSLAALATVALMVGFVVPRVGHATHRAQRAMGTLNSSLERLLGALRTVKACDAEDRESARAHVASIEAWRANLTADRWQAVISSVSELSVQIAFVAVLATGGAQVASGTISVGTLVAFLLYVFYLAMPVQQLTTSLSQYQVGAAAATRIMEAEKLPAEHTDAGGTSPVPGNSPVAVAFDQVRFRYRPELPDVHHGVTFSVSPGGMTAFVGPSGAGKTTVFSLIERFYDADSGTVLIDGIDIRDWPLRPLRAAIGYVEQDAPVLSGTIRENLLFGAPDSTDAELREVLRITRLTDMVNGLPDGLETFVGHRGMRLSGGERQRVAIARALLRRPRLLLLDEATSQLDAINEAALRETVADVAQMMTVLVVAHRLSTVTMADRIIVMDVGRVQATGTHAELVEANPLYAELATTQFLATGI